MDHDNIQAAIDAGERIGELKHAGTIHRVDADDVPFVLVPEGLALLGLEHLLATPTRARAAVTLHEAASFVDYVLRYKQDGTVVFSDLATLTWVAVLDYHEPEGGAPGWGAHRATFTCRPTPEWKAWHGSNGKAHARGQLEFAEFLEDRIPDLVQPDGATLLEVVTGLEAKKDVNFRSSVRTDSGEQQLVYEETINTTARKGTILIPTSITVQLRPFEGTSPRHIDARLRHRISDGGHLSLWYDLIRWEVLLEQAFTEVRTQVAAGLTGVPTLAGSAPTMPVPSKLSETPARDR